MTFISRGMKKVSQGILGGERLLRAVSKQRFFFFFHDRMGPEQVVNLGHPKAVVAGSRCHPSHPPHNPPSIPIISIVASHPLCSITQSHLPPSRTSQVPPTLQGTPYLQPNRADRDIHTRVSGTTGIRDDVASPGQHGGVLCGGGKVHQILGKKQQPLFESRRHGPNQVSVGTNENYTTACSLALQPAVFLSENPCTSSRTASPTS